MIKANGEAYINISSPEDLTKSTDIKYVLESIKKMGERHFINLGSTAQIKVIETLIKFKYNKKYELINNRYMNDLTQSETSKIMGMSQVQVSRKEQKVLKKINSKMAA